MRVDALVAERGGHNFGTANARAAALAQLALLHLPPPEVSP